MRRKDKEITEREVIEEILRENQVGRLGTAVDGVPYIVPMNFVYTEGKIFLHTHRDGKKVGNILANPRVCFEVDSGELVKGDDPCNYSWAYRSVIADGRAVILREAEEKLNALRAICEKYALGESHKLTLDVINKFKDLWIIEIAIEHMTGKESTPTPQADNDIGAKR